MNVHTREIAKELSFEDISVHSPGLFRNGDAMRALKANPDVPTFRRALAELNQTQDSFRKILEGAAEKALGNGEADLERIKTNIKRLKFGTIELGTERAFLRSILESRPVPSAPPTETEEFKARNAELKQLKDANDAEERRVEELVRAVEEMAPEDDARSSKTPGSAGTLTLYQRLQPCHGSSDNRGPLWSCSDALVDGLHRELLGPRGVSLRVAVSYTYRAHWDVRGFESERERRWWGPKIEAAREGIRVFAAAEKDALPRRILDSLRKREVAARESLRAGAPG